MKDKTPDVFEEDFYDDVSDVAGEYNKYSKSDNGWLSSLRSPVNVAENSPKEEDFSYQTEVTKTLDLKFIDGILHQKSVKNVYKVNIFTYHSEAITSEEIWEKIPSEVTT